MFHEVYWFSGMKALRGHQGQQGYPGAVDRLGQVDQLESLVLLDLVVNQVLVITVNCTSVVLYRNCCALL